ncbi:myb-like protein X [Drosophila yakuba]|uniref:myb-like protein X n=1 Tax=Drosophila yakuba TaxID=7245 RepID=UPI0019308448|nr:myb-like protein X [Drosophila yakuba]
MPAKNIKNLIKKELQFLCSVNNLETSGTRNVLIWRLQRVGKQRIEQSLLKLKSNCEFYEMENSEKNADLTKNDNEKRNENVKTNDNEKRDENVKKNDNEKRDENVKTNDNEKRDENVKKNGNEKRDENVKKNDNEKKDESARKNDNEKINDNEKENDSEKEEDNAKETDEGNGNENVKEQNKEKQDENAKLNRNGKDDDLDVILQKFEMFKKNEKIRQLEMQLMEMEIQKKYVESAKNKISLEMLKEMIHVFDGDNKFAGWRTMINGVRKIYNVDDDMMRAVIFNKVKDKASKLITRQKLQVCTWKRGQHFDEYF